MGGVGAAAPWPPESQERRRGRESRTRKKKNEGSPIFKEKGEGAFGLRNKGGSLMICSPNLP